MSKSQAITVGFGKANFSSVLMSIAALKVEAPWQRVSAWTSGVSVSGSKVWIPAGEHEMNGGFTRVRTEHENGRIIFLQSSWVRGGSPIRDGAIAIRLRHGAPLYDIFARVPTAAQNRCGDVVQAFQGMGDILTPEELRVAGLDVPRYVSSKFFDPEEIDECFRITRISGESIPRPTLQSVATPEGIQVREVANVPQRRIRIRRG